MWSLRGAAAVAEICLLRWRVVWEKLQWMQMQIHGSADADAATFNNDDEYFVRRGECAHRTIADLHLQPRVYFSSVFRVCVEFSGHSIETPRAIDTSIEH